MLKLLEIEYRKLIPYRSFWMAVLAYALLMPGLFISLHKFHIDVNHMTLGINFYNFPDVWQNNTYIASWFNVLLYFFVILVVTNEYQFRTLRQNVIDGLSRWQVLGSKVLLILSFAIGSTLLVAVVSLLCGMFLAEEGFRQVSWDKFEYVGLYFIQVLGFMSFALFVATIFRKQGMSIIVFIGYTLVGEALLRYLILPKFHLPIDLGPYLPFQNIGGLIPNPLPVYFGAMKPTPLDPKVIVIACIYTAAFLLCSGFILAKRDL